MSPPNDETPKTNPDEERLLERMRERRGEEYVEENRELILAQARLVGDL